MQNTSAISVKSHIYAPQPKKIKRNFITENIFAVSNKNPIKKFLTNLFKRKKTIIITDIKNNPPSKLKQNKSDVVPLKITYSSKYHAKPDLNTTRDIDFFVNILKKQDIHLENESPPTESILKSSQLKFNKQGQLILDHYIGSGTYGSVYRIGNFAIKIPKNKEHLNTNFAKLGRSRRILTDINQDKDFARVLTLKNGRQILVTKFIDGKSITGKDAFNFVKSRGRILHDNKVNGNVKKDKQGKLYLIDADFATLPIEKRRDSLGSNELYALFPKYTRHYLGINKKVK